MASVDLRVTRGRVKQAKGKNPTLVRLCARSSVFLDSRLCLPYTHARCFTSTGYLCFPLPHGRAVLEGGGNGTNVSMFVSSAATGMQLPQGKPLTQAHLQMLRQQQQLQQQTASPQIKAVGKPQQVGPPAQGNIRAWALSRLRREGKATTVRSCVNPRSKATAGPVMVLERPGYAA